MKKSLRIGGVPEHFNLPWHIAIESGALELIGVDAQWTDYPEGTGSMVTAINAGEVDIAMLLTEGALKGLSNDCDYEIVSFYTLTPLLWGIHVPTKSDLNTLDDLVNTPFAISRYGSGSHLMAYLFAQQQGWNIEKLSFNPIGDLQGARELFKTGKSCIFLWEKFMTQPLIDNGEFRRLGVLPAPWPGFVICVRKSLLVNHANIIANLLKVIFETATELKTSPIATKLIAGRFGLTIQSVKEWLTLTQWAENKRLDQSVLDQTQQRLKTLNLL